jgi:hypothetical protein
MSNVTSMQTLLRDRMRGYLHNVIATALRGVLSSLPQENPETLILEFARSVGVVMGQTIKNGDIGAVSALRTKARQSFREGMESVEIG